MKIETKLNVNEILTKLSKLQADVDYIKSHIGKEDRSLEAEMRCWEKISVEDTSDFFKKYNL